MTLLHFTATSSLLVGIFWRNEEIKLPTILLYLDFFHLLTKKKVFFLFLGLQLDFSNLKIIIETFEFSNIALTISFWIIAVLDLKINFSLVEVLKAFYWWNFACRFLESYILWDKKRAGERATAGGPPRNCDADAIHKFVPMLRKE